VVREEGSDEASSRFSLVTSLWVISPAESVCQATYEQKRSDRRKRAERLLVGKCCKRTMGASVRVCSGEALSLLVCWKSQ